jgi:hypothetical protein
LCQHFHCKPDDKVLLELRDNPVQYEWMYTHWLKSEEEKLVDQAKTIAVYNESFKNQKMYDQLWGNKKASHYNVGTDEEFDRQADQEFAEIEEEERQRKAAKGSVETTKQALMNRKRRKLK